MLEELHSFASSVELCYHVAPKREGYMVQLALPGHRPLTIERLSNRLLLIGCIFDEHRNLIRDPEFTFHTNRGRWTPVSVRRGKDLIVAVDLDDHDRIVEVDLAKVEEIMAEAERFVKRLRAEGLLDSAGVLVVVPRAVLPHSMN